MLCNLFEIILLLASDPESVLEYSILSFYQCSVLIYLRLNTNWLLLLGFTEVEAEYTWPFSTKCCIKTRRSLSLMCLYCYSHFRYYIFICCTVSFIYLFSVPFMYVNVGSWSRFHNLAIIRNNLIDSANQPSIIFRTISLWDSIRNPFIFFICEQVKLPWTFNFQLWTTFILRIMLVLCFEVQ